jgi:hypothetical protein
MKDKEVLQKAIEIAIKNGMSANTIDKGTFFQIYWLNKGRKGSKIDKVGYSVKDCYGLIFSHSFAKAFWGEGDNDKVCKSCDHYVAMDKIWQYHLQEMVLEENPINYLRKFIDNTETKK